MPSLINLDFADVRTTMKDKGIAHMGIGVGQGETRAVDAARAAITSPLLETTIDGARSVLINITGDNSLGLMEIEEAASLVASAVDPEANIIFGAGIDDQLEDQVRITVIATGFDNRSAAAGAATPVRKVTPIFSGSFTAGNGPAGESTQTTRSSAASETATPPQQPVQRNEDTPRTAAATGGYTPRPNYYGGNPAPQQPARGSVNVEEDDLDIPPFLKRRR